MNSSAHAAVLAHYDLDSGGTGLNPTSTVSSVTATAVSNTFSGQTGLSQSGPPNLFVRVQVTPNSEAAAVLAGTYFAFTVTPLEAINLESLVLSTTTSASVAQAFTGTLFVRSSADNFQTTLGSFEMASTTSTAASAYTAWTSDLSGAEYQNLDDPITFRIYAYDDSDSSVATNTVHRIDYITLNGSVVPEPGRAILLLLAAGVLFVRRHR